MSNTDRLSWDDSAADAATANFNRIANQLESLINQRDQDVKRAMSDYQADGISDQYQIKEQRWNQAASEVKQIITTLRRSLEESQQLAGQAAQQARRAVESI